MAQISTATHDLKINQEYLMNILLGKKTFEVRFNDRDYQDGDIIRFLPLESKVIDIYDLVTTPIPHYIITYISSYMQADKYVVLGIKPTSTPELK